LQPALRLIGIPCPAPCTRHHRRTDACAVSPGVPRASHQRDRRRRAARRLQTTRNRLPRLESARSQRCRRRNHHRCRGARAGRHVQLLFRRAVRGRPDDGSSRDADDVGELHADDNACLTHELRRRFPCPIPCGSTLPLQPWTKRVVHGDARRHDRLRRSHPDHDRPALRTRHTDFSRSVTNKRHGKDALGGRERRSHGYRKRRPAAVHGDGFPDRLYTFATGATASHVRTWSSTFTADQAGTIQAGSPLPSGNWNIAGRRRGRPGSSATRSR